MKKPISVLKLMVGCSLFLLFIGSSAWATKLPHEDLDYGIETDRFQNGGELVGENINILTGNMIEAASDLSFPSPNKLGFSFNRTYNSRAEISGILGYGWTPLIPTFALPAYRCRHLIKSVRGKNEQVRNYVGIQFRNFGIADHWQNQHVKDLLHDALESQKANCSSALQINYPDSAKPFRSSIRNGNALKDALSYLGYADECVVICKRQSSGESRKFGDGLEFSGRKIGERQCPPSRLKKPQPAGIPSE